MKLFTLTLLAISTLAALSFGADPSEHDRNEWDKLTDAQYSLCREYMDQVLAHYEAGRRTEAMDCLEAGYLEAERQFGDAEFYYLVIWWEAQTESGKEDEEWGLQLFQYLLDRTHRTKPESAIRISTRDTILHCNIASRFYELGKQAQARSMIMAVEDSHRAYVALDTGYGVYPDTGPLFSFLPEARKRKFPMLTHDLPETNRCCSSSHLIRYPYMYGVRTIAQSAQNQGDWVRATELNDWFISYADEYVKDSKRTMRFELCKNAFYVTRRQARICLLHDYPEEAARLYEEYLAKAADEAYPAPEAIVLEARLELAVVQIRMGILPEDAIELAEAADKAIEEFVFASRWNIIHTKLNKARIYHAAGFRADAWAIVNRLFDETANDVNPHHQIRLLNTAIDLALAEGGTMPELEAWLVLALDNERMMGNKFNELPLYEKYARFLKIHGRDEEALQILQEALRLSNSMRLPRRIERNRLAMAAIHAGTDIEHDVTLSQQNGTQSEVVEKMLPPTQSIPEAKAEETGKAASASLLVDIQPSFSETAALAGQPAHGRFYVINPSTDSVTGQLVLQGCIEQVGQQSEGWLIARSSPVFEDTTISRELVLSPAECCIIDLLGQPSRTDGTGAGIECSFLVGGKVCAEGVWTYRESATAGQRAVIDAHEVKSNPFYLIPLHHTVQRAESTTSEAVDFMIQASSAMRIEVYDEKTGELLCIDNNGDGDFEDQGDLIASDSNRNNRPDFYFETGHHVASLVMYVRPKAVPSEEQELTISLLENGLWRMDAVDVIK